MVERQNFQVLGLEMVCLQDYSLDWGFIFDDAITATEEIVDGEIGRHAEGDAVFLQAGDAVEGEGVERVVFRIASQNIPATLEDLNSVWLHVFVQLLFIRIEFLIFHVEGAAVVH